MPRLPPSEVEGDTVYLLRLPSSLSVYSVLRHGVADPLPVSAPANDRTVSVALVSNKLATTILKKA